jgi:hypothetical protein
MIDLNYMSRSILHESEKHGWSGPTTRPDINRERPVTIHGMFPAFLGGVFTDLGLSCLNRHGIVGRSV